MSYTKHIEDAIIFATNADNVITEADVLNLSKNSWPHPMSTAHSQTLLNKLCKVKDDVNYLEVGVLHGASYFAASFDNSGNFYGIDNWSKYRSSQKTIEDHIKKYSDKDRNYCFLNHDCWDIEFLRKNLNHKIDIFFYDGDHSYDSQSKVLTHFSEFLADEIILIIDDYFCEPIIQDVQGGTADTIKNSDFNVVKEFKIKNKELPSTASKAERSSANLWHNGFYVAHLKR